MTSSRTRFSAWFVPFLCLALMVVISACNLNGSPDQQETIQTETPATTLLPSRTPASTSGLPATAQFPTFLPTVSFATAVSVFPTSAPPIVIPPTASFPLNIAVLSPVPGNIVAGNVQVLGSASHPQFLQYQLEFGPDPNPGNLWFPASSPVMLPVLNGLLGVWNTQSVQDATYQLRLRVYLRDGRIEQTVIGNITIQNHINTPVPSPTPNIPRPIAAFTQDVTSGQIPLNVHFTNQSTGSINVISWNFGDGTSSSEVNPVHSFGTPGLYTVTLTVTGPGGSSNVSRQISVNSPTAPVAGFTMDRAGGIAPLTVQFVDQSTGTVNGYLWNFSDGITSTDRNPQHIFSTPGTYNIILTVTGPGGSSSVIRQIGVTSLIPPSSTPVPPTATWTWTPIPPTSSPTNVLPTVALPTDTPTSTDTSLPIPTSTGMPTATATVTETPIPAPVASYSGAIDPANPLAVQFTNTSSGQIVGYQWSFGDNTTAPDQNPYHVYPASGSYNVTLTVTDSVGRTNAISQTVTVMQLLNAQFASNAAPNVPQTIQFTDQSSGGVAPYTYNWDFGDGLISNEQSPAHAYAQGGTYSVHLLVLDSQGHSDDFSADIQVAAAPPTQTPIPAPVASFSGAVDPANPLMVKFTNTSSGQIVGYQWDFGDNTTAQDQNPRHVYPAGGSYNVTLTVTDSAGRTNAIAQMVTVAQPLNAQFASSASPDAPQTIQFLDQTSGGIAPYTYSWDFGDGLISNEQNPVHGYAQGGTYSVRLLVLDSQGHSDDFSADIQITAAPPSATPIPEPVASFSGAIDPANPLAVQFTNTSSGQIVGYQWDFGDTTSAEDQNPYHVYPAGGSYNVTLTVTDSVGRTNAIAQMVTVAQGLNAQFTSDTSLHVPLTVQLLDQTSGGVPPYTYTWDFGDGQSANDQSPIHVYTQGGTYTVRLVVQDSQGPSDDFSMDVEVVDAVVTAVPPPSIVDNTPIFPDLSDPKHLANTSQTYQNGASAGNHASVFTYTGGMPLAQNEIIHPFAPGAAYNLSAHSDLQAIIDWFNQTDLGSGTSFVRSSLAAGQDWTVLDLVDPNRSNPSVCNPGETPLDCELRLTQPVMIFISVGQNDISREIDVGTFQNTLNQVVNTANSHGVIPVLLTIPAGNGIGSDVLLTYNESIINAADQSGALVLNIARLLSTLPDGGSGGFGLSVSPSGAGDLDDGTLASYGANAVNYAILRTLNDVRAAVFSGAAP